MWVLVVVMIAFNYGGTVYNMNNSVGFQEFNTEHNCQVAASKISYSGVKAFCVQK